MLFLSIIFSAVLLGLLAFSIAFRTRIASLLRGAGLYIAGTWNYVWPVIRGTVLTAITIGGVGWLILIVLMVGIGAYANSITAALIISILFPFWFVSMLIPRRVIPASAKWKIPIFGIIRVFGGFVLLIASLSLAVGIWSPDTKGAINERLDDSKVWTANSFKKGSAHSERNAGVRGRVKSATEVYDDFNKPIAGIVPAGRIIMVLSLQGKPATKDREALLPVMLPNKHGNFVDGSVVWMPALKIEFISNEEQETSTAKDSVASAVPIEKRKLCWHRPEGYAGIGKEKNAGCSDIFSFKNEGDNIVFKIKNAANGDSVYLGSRTEGFKFRGIWTQVPKDLEGEWEFEFAPDMKTADNGWQNSKGSSNSPSWIR